MTDYGKAISLDPKKSLFFGNRASLRDDKGDLAGALADYQQAIALGPNNPVYLNNRGLVEHKQKNEDAAIADYTAALKLNPKDATFFANRAASKKMKGDWDGAVADYTSSINLSDKPVTYIYRGWAKFVTGDSVGAAADEDHAVKELPDLPAPYLNRAYARFALGQGGEAASDFQKSLDLKGDDQFYPRFFLCLIRQQIPGQKDPAMAELDGFLSAHTDANAWALQIGKFLTGKVPEADFLASAKENGQVCEANFYTGMIHELNGDKPGALSFYQKSVDTGVNDYAEFQISRVKVAAK